MRPPPLPYKHSVAIHPLTELTKNMVLPKFPRVSHLLLCLLVLAAILRPGTGNAAEPFAGPYPYPVVATTGMVGDMVRAVAGDRATVRDIIPPGTDPHLYKASREDMLRLNQARVVFYTGLLLEGQLANVLSRVGGQKPVVAVGERLPRERLLLHEGEPDPHVWMDAALWAKGIAAVEEALSAFDPANAALYAENAARYREELLELDSETRAVLATIPEDRRVMITAHDAFGYLGRANNIEVMGIQGLSTESEAGLQDINRLVDLIVSRNIPAVFVETSVADKNVRALVEGARSRGHEIVIGGELFSDAMGPAGTSEGTYVGMIRHNAETIARALGGTVPPAEEPAT